MHSILCDGDLHCVCIRNLFHERIIWFFGWPFAFLEHFRNSCGCDSITTNYDGLADRKETRSKGDKSFSAEEYGCRLEGAESMISINIRHNDDNIR